MLHKPRPHIQYLAIKAARQHGKQNQHGMLWQKMIKR